MVKKNWLVQINDVISYDIDAFFAYTRFLKYAKNKELVETFQKFKDEHLQHIKTLSIFVYQAGGMPPSFKVDMKGCLIEKFITITSKMSEAIALKALYQNEKLVRACYKKALNLDIENEELRTTLKNNYEDEDRHIKFIESKIK